MGLSAQKRAYYEEHIEAWRHSGLSQIKYCEQAQISYGSFKSWSGKLKQSEAIKTEFVEAKPLSVTRLWCHITNLFA